MYEGLGFAVAWASTTIGSGCFIAARRLSNTVSIDPALPDFDYGAALQSCARGDRDALRLLYEREGAHLLGVALRIVRDRAVAEDVLHDAFVSIWTRAIGFDAKRGEGRGWMFSIVRNASLNRIRSSARMVTLGDDAAEAVDDAAALASYRSAADPMELRSDLGRLQRCLTQLEPARRDCIVFAYVDGCSHAEIAERTGTALGTIKSWIQRGMVSLRECMA